MATEGHRTAADLGIATATTLGDRADLSGHRRGVLGMAGENLNRQRLALGVAQQPDDDLPLALFAVAVVAEGGQLIADPFEIAAGDIVEEKPRRAGRCRGCEEPIFDMSLVFVQPIQIGVQVVLVEALQSENVPARRSCNQTHSPRLSRG